MKIPLKIFALASLLFSSVALQSHAMEISDGAPKTRYEIAFERNMAYWQSTGQYYRPASVRTSATEPQYPLTKSEISYKQSWDYWNKVGYKSTPAKHFNLYTDVSEYPLPHTQVSPSRGGWVWAPNRR